LLLAVIFARSDCSQLNSNIMEVDGMQDDSETDEELQSPSLLEDSPMLSAGTSQRIDAEHRT
jgi:hypothetical protein